MAKLTKKELAWIKKVQKVFDECPSSRIGFYACGEDTLHLYDKDNKKAVSNFNESGLSVYTKTFTDVLSNSDADFGHFIRLPSHIEIG